MVDARPPTKAHEDVLERVRLGALGSRRGLGVERLADIDQDLLAALELETMTLLSEERPSDATDPAHRSSWVRPKGTVQQYSLLNRTGSFDDTSADHDGRSGNKRFHHEERFPALHRFLGWFPDLLNARVNVLGPGAHLPLHEERVWFLDGRSVWCRLRLHVPVLTNPQSEVVLEGRAAHLEAGALWAFNNGCVHSAANGGQSPRVHIVADIRLTGRAMDLLYGPADLPAGLCRVPTEQRQPVMRPVRRPRGYRVSSRAASLHRVLRLDRFGVPAWTLNELDRLFGRSLPTPSLAYAAPDTTEIR